MATIAITGASGSVGREAVAALEEAHELRLLTRRDHEDIDSRTVDVADREGLEWALRGCSILVHLAAQASPYAEWSDLVKPNIEGLYNAFDVAVETGYDRVIFASSNHAVHGYNVADPAQPETIAEGPAVRTVDPGDPPLPDSLYGATKVFGEAMGNFFARRHGLEVINLRIGWLMDDDELRETQSDDEVDDRFARAMWLSPRDCRDVIRRSATEPIPGTPLTLNAVSRNDERYLSIADTQQAIGYRPRDNSAEVVEGGPKL